MSVVDLRKWTATAIEIALDLEIRKVQDYSQVALSEYAEPRITLVAAFASTAQLERICGAIARAAPEKLPGGLRITPPERAGRPIGIRSPFNRCACCSGYRESSFGLSSRGS